jgi:hypothetical protein
MLPAKNTPHNSIRNRDHSSMDSNRNCNNMWDNKPGNNKWFGMDSNTPMPTHSEQKEEQKERQP